MTQSTFQTQPPASSIFKLSFPEPRIMLVTICRAKQMNSIPMYGHIDGDEIWKWFDREPSLFVGIITGEGSKAFCAGADLVQQAQKQGLSVAEQQKPVPMPSGGFAGLSNRVGRKPVIAAVNGYALGGGTEIIMNVDCTIASPSASFGIPEVQRGIFAGAGGLSRLPRIVGMPIASELALTGRRMTAQEAKDFHLINRISKTPETLMDEALSFAREISSLSPDAVIATRAGLRESWEQASVERSSQLTTERFGYSIMTSPNTKIGLQAFAEKRIPQWVGPKL